MSARRERVVFDNVYKKLERELLEKKKQMANIIELSNLSYEQRDNFQVCSRLRVAASALQKSDSYRQHVPPENAFLPKTRVL
jgi:hypothetical protein